MCDEVVQGESEGEDGSYDADGEGAIDGGPPATVNARIADENEETDAEEKLRNSGEVERSRIGEDRHGCCKYEGERSKAKSLGAR